MAEKPDVIWIDVPLAKSKIPSFFIQPLGALDQYVIMSYTKVDHTNTKIEKADNLNHGL